MQTTDQKWSGGLGAALEREHREIDRGIEAFRNGIADGWGELDIAAIAAPLERAIEALRRHIYLEEKLLFPPMRAEFAIPLGVMLREHAEIWATLDELERKLQQGEAPASLLNPCDRLSAALDAHNAKEEPIFYTEADRSLNAAESAQLETFLDSGEMPGGWVCQAAR